MLKFQNCFPGASAVIRRPGLTLLVAGGLSFLAWPLGTVFMLAPLCLWTLLGSLFLERRLLDALIFPPFTSTIFLPALGTGIGMPALFMIYGKPEFPDALPWLQIAHLFAFPFAWAGYRIGFGPMEAKAGQLQAQRAAACPALFLFAWLWLGTATVIFLLKILLGWEGRGALLPSFKPSETFPFEPAQLMSLFPVFLDAPYFFTAFLWRLHGLRGRLALGSLLVLFFAAGLATGSRGTIVWPALFIWAGCFFFRKEDSRFFERAFLVLLGGVLAFGWVGLNIRSYVLERGVDSRNILERIVSLKDFFGNPEPEGRQAGVASFFVSMYPWYDERIFDKTPRKIPHSGWEGWEGVLCTPIPHTLMPNKATLFDMEAIYKRYCEEDQLRYHAQLGEPVGRGSILSTQADAFRRFGWAGVPPALFLAYLAFGLLARWMLSLGDGHSLYQWSLLAISATFLKGKPMMSLLMTWWSFAYFWPKHLIVLFLVCLAFQFLYSRRFRFRKKPNPAGDGARTLPPG